MTVKNFDFCRVVSAKKLKGSGLGMGDVVMVLGTRQVPASAKDPYLFRTLVTVAKVEDELIQIPKDENEYKAYLVDPRSLEVLVGDEHEKHDTNRQKQFG